MNAVVKDAGGRTVAGFNADVGVVSFAGSPEHAKIFKSPAAAARWARKYSDAGYGLTGATVAAADRVVDKAETGTRNDFGRFVWIVGAIREECPDLPAADFGGALVLWDRQESKEVARVAAGYANALCLETLPGRAPFTAMEEWFNSLDDEALSSEGIAPSAPRWKAVAK